MNVNIDTYSVIKLLYLVCLCDTVRADTPEGIEFPGDVLVGRDNLIENGGQYSSPMGEYQVTLMPVEGDVAKYYNGSGYFMGFQFTNAFRSGYFGQIKLQLYSLKTVDSTTTPPGGTYTLLYESEWIYPVRGLNYYLFPQAIKMIPPITPSLFMGFLVSDYTTVLPIYHDESCPENTYVLVESLRSEPLVGSDIEFQYRSFFGCRSFSFQGIISPRYTGINNAFDGKGCDVYNLMYGETRVISRFGVLTNRADSSCVQVRAEKSDYAMQIWTEQFDLPCATDPLEMASISIGDSERFFTGRNNEEHNLWGSYCGTPDDIFDSEKVNRPVLEIFYNGKNWTATQGYTFRIRVIDQFFDQWVSLIAGLVVLGVLILVILVIIIVCCCVSARKKKENRIT